MAPISVPRAALLAFAAAPAAVSAFSAPMPIGALSRASTLCSGPVAPARRSVVALRMNSGERELVTNTPEEDAAFPLPDNVSREDFLALRAEGMGPGDAVGCEAPLAEDPQKEPGSHTPLTLQDFGAGLEKGMTMKESLLMLDKAFARRDAMGDAQVPPRVQAVGAIGARLNAARQTQTFPCPLEAVSY